MGELDNLSHTATFLTELRRKIAGTLDFLKQVTGPLETTFKADASALSAIEFHELLALRMGVLSLTAKVRWCDESLEMIAARPRTRRRKNA
jgi:hypothetical protein